MEQQAKERLTGGVILVVLLVLLVPELLTGPRPAPPPTPAQPDQAPMRSYTMELGESAHANSAPVAASTSRAAGQRAGEARLRAAGGRPDGTAQHRVPLTRPHRPPWRRAGDAGRAAHPRDRRGGARRAIRGDLDRAARNLQQSGECRATRCAALSRVASAATLSEATKNGHKLFRVRVGAEKDRAAAQKLLGRLKAAGEKGAQIVPR